MILLFIGGMCGGLGRHLLARLLPPLWATWLANTIACACLSVAMHHPEWRLTLGIGIAGALSTWSTLAAELGLLIKQHQYFTASSYFLSTIIMGVIVSRF